MARYKEYSYEQTKLTPISFDHQIPPGTFEYTLNYLIDNEVDLSLFEQRYHNDETGASANHDQGEFMKEDKQSGKKNQMEFLARVFTDRGPSQNRLFLQAR